MSDLPQLLSRLDLPPTMKASRRKFLKRSGVAALAGAVGGALWMKFSDSRLARVGRMLTSDIGRDPAPSPQVPQPDTWDDNRVTFTWIGHATVLINFYGVRILTDPVFSDRVGVDAGIVTLGPKRYFRPALPFDQLPPIDLVLLSHGHMDHMDLPTLSKFAAQQKVVTAYDTTEILKPTKLANVSELNWNEQTTVKTARGEIHVEAFEVRHWGRRWPNDRERGYNGYVLRREGRALLFGGDTAMTPLFGNLRSRGPYAAAIMPIGAYDPWIHAHCTPEEALHMADLAGARLFAPIHHSTFKLSDEPMTEPSERIHKALAAEKDRLALKETGDTVTLA
jgi:L-ascorbate metabolism protein UlaG (beta-lactamase superfamily)